MLSAFEIEVARTIVGALELEVAPEEIDPQEPLFSDGLGLDSIDALELALVFSEQYGLQFENDYEDSAEIFANLHTLAQHIEKNRRV